MSAILDILIVVIIGVTIGFAVKKRLRQDRAVGGELSHRAGGRSFCSSHPCATRFWKAGWRSRCGRRWTSITSFVTDTSEEQEELPEFLTKLEFIGIDKDELQTKWNDWRSGNTETLKNELVGYVSRAGPVRGGGDLYGLHPALPRLGAGAAAGGLSARQADRPAHPAAGQQAAGTGRGRRAGAAARLAFSARWCGFCCPAPIRSGWTSSPASTRRRPSCSNSFYENNFFNFFFA